jgi:hypothetical protein
MALTKIKTGGITDSAITTAKINNNAVTDAKVADAITVTGAQTGITQVGTLTAGTWQGTKIASAYLDDDTAHLSGSTFTGTVSLGDLDIIPTSSNVSVIKHDSGSGSLTLQGDQVNIKNRAGDETGLSYNDGGGVILSHNSKATSASADTTFKIETTSGTTIFPVLDFVSSHSSVGGKIRQDGSDVITIDNDQDVTFADDINATGNITTDGIFKVDTAPDSDVIQFDQSGRKSAIKTYFSSSSTGSKVIVKVSDGNTNGGMVDALDVRPADAIFAGDVTVDGNRYMLTESGTNKGFFGKDDWATSSGSADNVNVGSYSGTVKITAGAATSSTSNIVCNTDKSTTFNGTVTIPSGSYVPDDHANFGIGAIVSNWGTAYDVLNVGHSSAYWCEVGDYADRGTGWGNNLYHNGSNYKTIYEDQASAIVQKAGEIKFYTVGVKATTTNMTSPGDNDERGSFRSDGEFRIGQGGDGYFRQYQINSNAHNYVMYTYSDDSYRWNRNGSGSDEMRLDSDGDLHILGSLSESSDVRLKKNIKTIDNALSKVNQLRGVTYNWKVSAGKNTDTKEIGMIADEVEEIIPELVKTDTVKGSFDKDGLDNIKSLKYGNVVGLLVEAVKELSAKVTALENA